MLVGIHQPHYLPWLRYFDKIARSDVFIVLDNVQYNKNGWQNRNRVKGAGGPMRLTVPVLDRFAQALDAVRIDPRPPWRRKHARAIAQAYARAPHYPRYADFFEDTYARPWECLNDLNRHMLEYFLDALDIRTPIVYASELDAPGAATGRLVRLVRAVGGDAYLTGAHALDAYLDAQAFARAGIALVIQDWAPPVYPQLHGAFVPDLSIVDLLANAGPASRDVLLGEQA